MLSWLGDIDLLGFLFCLLAGDVLDLLRLSLCDTVSSPLWFPCFSPGLLLPLLSSFSAASVWVLIESWGLESCRSRSRLGSEDGYTLGSHCRAFWLLPACLPLGFFTFSEFFWTRLRRSSSFTELFLCFLGSGLVLIPTLLLF
ncbi:hypothetical protein CC2G_009989 [Coprinopsis cinerea AmutBmut pab1-1]|nr:hypothetical protein CC2G_009989 [Coprinopsis cinerea AmutBmut pab1-1]